MDEHAEVVREALWHLDAQCEAIGWEQPAQLLFVFAGEDTYTFYPVPSWDDVLVRTGHPAEAMQVLETLAQYFPPPTTDLYGLILVTEGWMLRDADTYAGGAIRDHPDRVEVRMLTLVTRNGDRAMLTHERDGIPRLLEDTETGTMAGRVPAQLPRLLQAIVRS